jgi:hypothetical protein
MGSCLRGDAAAEIADRGSCEVILPWGQWCRRQNRGPFHHSVMRLANARGR